MMSARFTAVAATSTITSPGPHTGSGTSPQPSTSGPPGSFTVTARMAGTVSAGAIGRAAATVRSSPLTLRSAAPGTRALRCPAAGEHARGTAPVPRSSGPPARAAVPAAPAVIWRCPMTAIPQPGFVPPPASRWSAGKIVALILGILLLLPGLGLLLGGGVLLWADRGSRNADGFLVSASDSFSTPGYALSSENVDLATGADWLPVSAAVGKVQVRVTGAGGSDVFIGIAPVSDATAY